MSELRPAALAGIDRHFWLTRSMARMIGVNLSNAMADGVLTADDYAEMVSKCRMCKSCERCLSWLGDQNGHAEAAPAFCVNAAQLNGLRR